MLDQKKAGQIDTKNAHPRPDLIAAIPFRLLSNILVSRRLATAFFSFLFPNNGIGCLKGKFEISYLKSGYAD